MRKDLFLFATIVAISCYCRATGIVEDSKCYNNGNLSATQRLQTYPFNKGFTVMIISFDSYRWKAPLDHDTIIDSLVYERKILSASAIDSLTDILYNYNYRKADTLTYIQQLYMCYEPREAILFMSDHGKVMAYLELCFECYGHRCNPSDDDSVTSKLPFGAFCDGKYKMLKQLMINQGITHFNDNPDKNPYAPGHHLK